MAKLVSYTGRVSRLHWHLSVEAWTLFLVDGPRRGILTGSSRISSDDRTAGQALATTRPLELSPEECLSSVVCAGRGSRSPDRATSATLKYEASLCTDRFDLQSEHNRGCLSVTRLAAKKSLVNGFNDRVIAARQETHYFFVYSSPRLLLFIFYHS